jgi:hypothetical protein
MTKRMRLPAFYVALVAMLFRALLPTGWMPNFGGAPGTPLVLCSLDGPVRIVLGPDGKPVKPSPDQNDPHQHDVCPFAAAPHFATPVAVAVPAPLVGAVAAEILAREQPQSASDFYTPQSPRGPPRIA